MRAELRTEFTVAFERGTDGEWCVEVRELDGSEFAKTYSPLLDVALHAAVPYMAAHADSPLPFGNPRTARGSPT